MLGFPMMPYSSASSERERGAANPRAAAPAPHPSAQGSGHSQCCRPAAVGEDLALSLPVPAPWHSAAASAFTPASLWAFSWPVQAAAPLPARDPREHTPVALHELGHTRTTALRLCHWASPSVPRRARRLSRRLGHPPRMPRGTGSRRPGHVEASPQKRPRRGCGKGPAAGLSGTQRLPSLAHWPRGGAVCRLSPDSPLR